GAPETYDLYQCEFEVMRKTDQFRSTGAPPRPRMSGLFRAVVVGPSGEEIYTDEYGRIRIQFFWDRLGKSNETSSVWVRVMMPWTGKNFGMQAIPRIGQEVCVLFEQNNPDYPLVIGMMYDAYSMPPYALPANMTQTGLKTDSSKGG